MVKRGDKEGTHVQVLSPIKILAKPKRSLSPVIATILLISLVLVLAAIIFLWARGFVAEQIEKFGKSADSVCSEVNIDANVYDNLGTKEIEISNRGNVNIYTFGIKQFFGGNSNMKTLDGNYSVDSGTAIRKTLAVDSGVTKIEVYPVILGTVRGQIINKPYTCLDQGKIITLN